LISNLTICPAAPPLHSTRCTANSLLTNMRFGDSADLQAAATAALTAVCSLNRANTLAALRELVHRLLQHEPKVGAVPAHMCVSCAVLSCVAGQWCAGLLLQHLVVSTSAGWSW
jgi:hypothetical protein